MNDDIELLQFVAIALGAVLILDVIAEVWKLLNRRREDQRELQRLARWRHNNRCYQERNDT